MPQSLLCPDWNQEAIIPVTVIHTLFDPFMAENISFPGPKERSEEMLFQFTEEQRQFASKAKVPKNLEELKLLVSIALNY